MKQESKRPLYKVLNEQRTKGEWYKEENSRIVRTGYLKSIGTFDPLYNEINDTQKDANAQYTALAVNNLDNLAYVLTAMITVFDGSIGLTMLQEETIKKAKEALARIS